MFSGRNFKLSPLSRIDDCPSALSPSIFGVGEGGTGCHDSNPFRRRSRCPVTLTHVLESTRIKTQPQVNPDERLEKGVVLLLLLLLEKEVQTNIFYLSFCGETCYYFSVLNKSIFGPIFEAAPMYSNMASAVPLSFRVLAAFKDDAAANELLESISRADAAGDHGHVT